ncbi:MAG: hypothetical protein ACI8SZ_000656, partial [Colwellia sp.]
VIGVIGVIGVTLYCQKKIVKMKTHMTQSKCIQFKRKRLWDDFNPIFF